MSDHGKAAAPDLQAIATRLGDLQLLLTRMASQEPADVWVPLLWTQSVFLGEHRRTLDEAASSSATDGVISGWVRQAQAVAGQYQDAMEQMAARYLSLQTPGTESPMPPTVSWAFALDEGGDGIQAPRVGPSVRAAGELVMTRAYAHLPDPVQKAFETQLGVIFDDEAYWQWRATPPGELASTGGRRSLISRTKQSGRSRGDLVIESGLRAAAARLDPELGKIAGGVEGLDQAVLAQNWEMREDGTANPVAMANRREAGALLRQMELSEAVATALAPRTRDEEGGAHRASPRERNIQAQPIGGLLEQIREYVRADNRRQEDQWEQLSAALREYSLRALAWMLPDGGPQQAQVADRANQLFRHRFAAHDRRQARAERANAGKRLGAPSQASSRMDEAPFPGLPPGLVPSLREVAAQKYPDADALIQAVRQAWGPTIETRVSDRTEVETEAGVEGSYKAHAGVLALSPETTAALGRFAQGDRTRDSVSAFSTLQHEILHAFSPARLDLGRYQLGSMTGRMARWEALKMEEGLVEWGAATLTSRAVLGVEDPRQTDDLSVSYVASVTGIERMLDTHGETAVGALWSEPTLEGRRSVHESLQGGPSLVRSLLGAVGRRLVGLGSTRAPSDGTLQARVAIAIPQMETAAARDAVLVPPAPIWPVAAPETPSRQGLRR